MRLLEVECRAGSVEIFLNTQIGEVCRTTEFIIRTSAVEFRSPVLVVATGGLSIPKIGATAFGYDLACQFGLNIIPTRPALVPLTFSATDRENYSDLAGVSTEVVASLGPAPASNSVILSEAKDRGLIPTPPHSSPAFSGPAPSFPESLLITHRGLSGPAILQISSYWQPGQALSIDLAPGQHPAASLRSAPTRTLAAARSALQQFLPNRLAVRWLDLHAPKSFTNPALDELERQLHTWTILPAGTEGYAKAEVTAGGVDTAELSSKTMESRKVPGLFFIGEVVDVTGHLGGFNFQWAWSSAIAAAHSL